MKRAMIVGFCLLAAATFAGEWGLLLPGPYPGPGPAGPEKHSKFFVVTVPVVGGEAEVALPLTQPKGAVVVVLGDKPARASVAGKPLRYQKFDEPELETMDVSPKGVRVDVSALPPGEHRLRLEGLSKPVVQVAVNEPESPVELSVQVKPLAARSGETVVVTANVADDGPVAEAQVVARLSTGVRLALRDDGQGADEKGGDGVFTAAFVAPETPGMAPVELRVEAAGRRASGERFVRMAPAAVMVAKPASGIAERGVAVSPEALVVPLLPASGRFRVEVLYAAEGQSFAWAQEEVTLAGEGVAVTLPRPRESWGADKALVRLLNLDTLGVEAELELPLTPLSAPPDFRALAQRAPELPPSKAEAARRFGDRKP
ncbi:MAG: choice-of-anchor X domain-containing protein [Thermoanaerobaculum sp.]